MNRIKVIVADIDGTLRGRNTPCPGECTLRMLEELHAKGVIIGIASGRPLWQKVEDHAKEWGINFEFDFMIGMNGSELLDTHTGERKMFHLLSREDLMEVFTGMEPLNLNPFIYKEGYQLSLREDPWIMQSAARHHNTLVVAKDPSELWEEPTAKILYRVQTEEEARVMEEHGRTLCNDHITCFKTNPTLLEFQSPLINKGIAVMKYCEEKGYSMDEVMAIGDAQNDLEMLKMAGVSVCMSNGMDDVKAVADYITEEDASNDGAGIFLDKHRSFFEEQ